MENRFLGLLEKSVKTHWNLPAFTDMGGDTYSYKEVARWMEKLHILLEKAGIRPEDKVALVGANSAHWAICFFGILTYGAVAVPILHEFNTDNIHHILNHAEAKALFVSKSSWEKLDEQAIPHIQLIVCLDDYSLIKSTSREARDAIDNMDEFFGQAYSDFTPEAIHYYIEDPEKLAVLNYTSGTTSSSKGVMLPYRSLWSNTQVAADRLPFIHAGDNIVCLLPMAHMYGLAFEVLNSFNKGCHVHFIVGRPAPQIVAHAYQTVRPRLILAVPLIIERAVKNYIFPVVGKPLVRFLLRVPYVSALIRERIADGLNKAFGDNFEELVIGGAALNKDVERLLRAIHFRYTVGYGMTECGPLIAYAQWDEFKPGSVGKIIDRMEVRIESDDPKRKVGEIWVRGMNNMLGYYKNPEATSEVMTPDGWMRTGDLGTVDADGFLFIRGRCKTMILGPNGQNIYPEEIENKLNSLPLVVESLVVSDGKKLTALIYPDWKQIDSLGMTSHDVEREMEQYVKQVNRCVPRYCKISRFEVRKNDFAKTPKKSIKRYLYQKPLS